MWITGWAEAALLLHFTRFALPMLEVATHTDYKDLYEESQFVIMQLRHELDQQKKMIFGSRQERFIPAQLTDPTQLSMGLPADTVAATSLLQAKKIEYTHVGTVPSILATTHQGRMKLPDHLERKEILVDVAGKEGCREIGRDITEELEYEPGKLKEVLPKSAIGMAFAYSIQRRPRLMIYATDAKLNIDNNPIENCIRPVAVGRKAYLFAGSHEAAGRSAILYSLMGTFKLHDINPFTWFKNVVEIIPSHPINKIQQLLPFNWKPPQ